MESREIGGFWQSEEMIANLQAIAIIDTEDSITVGERVDKAIRSLEKDNNQASQVINVVGDGGAGKSTLCARVVDSLQLKEILTVYTNLKNLKSDYTNISNEMVQLVLTNRFSKEIMGQDANTKAFYPYVFAIQMLCDSEDVAFNSSLSEEINKKTSKIIGGILDAVSISLGPLSVAPLSSLGKDKIKETLAEWQKKNCPERIKPYFAELTTFLKTGRISQIMETINNIFIACFTDYMSERDKPIVLILDEYEFFQNRFYGLRTGMEWFEDIIMQTPRIFFYISGRKEFKPKGIDDLHYHLVALNKFTEADTKRYLEQRLKGQNIVLTDSQVRTLNERESGNPYLLYAMTEVIRQNTKALESFLVPTNEGTSPDKKELRNIEEIFQDYLTDTNESTRETLFLLGMIQEGRISLYERLAEVCHIVFNRDLLQSWFSERLSGTDLRQNNEDPIYTMRDILHNGIILLLNSYMQDDSNFTLKARLLSMKKNVYETLFNNIFEESSEENMDVFVDFMSDLYSEEEQVNTAWQIKRNQSASSKGILQEYLRGIFRNATSPNMFVELMAEEDADDKRIPETNGVPILNLSSAYAYFIVKEQVFRFAESAEVDGATKIRMAKVYQIAFKGNHGRDNQDLKDYYYLSQSKDFCDCCKLLSETTLRTWDENKKSIIKFYKAFSWRINDLLSGSTPDLDLSKNNKTFYLSTADADGYVLSMMPPNTWLKLDQDHCDFWVERSAGVLDALSFVTDYYPNETVENNYNQYIRKIVSIYGENSPKERIAKNQLYYFYRNSSFEDNEARCELVLKENFRFIADHDWFKQKDKNDASRRILDSYVNYQLDQKNYIELIDNTRDYALDTEVWMGARRIITRGLLDAYLQLSDFNGYVQLLVDIKKNISPLDSIFQLYDKFDAFNNFYIHYLLISKKNRMDFKTAWKQYGHDIRVTPEIESIGPGAIIRINYLKTLYSLYDPIFDMEERLLERPESILKDTEEKALNENDKVIIRQYCSVALQTYDEHYLEQRAFEVVLLAYIRVLMLLGRKTPHKEARSSLMFARTYINSSDKENVTNTYEQLDKRDKHEIIGSIKKRTKKKYKTAYANMSRKVFYLDFADAIYHVFNRLKEVAVDWNYLEKQWAQTYLQAVVTQERGEHFNDRHTDYKGSKENTGKYTIDVVSSVKLIKNFVDTYQFKEEVDTTFMIVKDLWDDLMRYSFNLIIKGDDSIDNLDLARDAITKLILSSENPRASVQYISERIRPSQKIEDKTQFENAFKINIKTLAESTAIDTVDISIGTLENIVKTETNRNIQAYAEEKLGNLYFEIMDNREKGLEEYRNALSLYIELKKLPDRLPVLIRNLFTCYTYLDRKEEGKSFLQSISNQIDSIPQSSMERKYSVQSVIQELMDDANV